LWSVKCSYSNLMSLVSFPSSIRHFKDRRSFSSRPEEIRLREFPFHTGTTIGRRIAFTETITLAHALVHKGRDSSVGIATCYRLDGPGIESRWK
jgi:hypothetical protein